MIFFACEDAYALLWWLESMQEADVDDDAGPRSSSSTSATSMIRTFSSGPITTVLHAPRCWPRSPRRSALHSPSVPRNGPEV